MKMIGGLMGGGAPTAKPEAQAGPQAQVKTETQAPAAVVENATRDAATPAVQLSAPQTPAPQVQKEDKPDEKQGLLMKAVEGLAKTFGVDLPALTKLLLKANPKIAEEALTEAAQALVAKQTAANPAPATAQ